MTGRASLAVSPPGSPSSVFPPKGMLITLPPNRGLMTQNLLSAAEVAEILGVSRWRVNQLATGRADFPRPAAVTHNAAGGVSGRLWRERDIGAWDATADRSPGRRRRLE